MRKTFKINFIDQLKAKKSENPYFTAAILKIQNGGHRGICANANISFRIPGVISFPKMYSFANLHKIEGNPFFFQNLSVSDKKGLISGVAQGYPAGTRLILDKGPLNLKNQQRKKLYQTKPGSEKIRTLAPGL